MVFSLLGKGAMKVIPTKLNRLSVTDPSLQGELGQQNLYILQNKKPSVSERLFTQNINRNINPV
jgi:hypothetical protein